MRNETDYDDYKEILIKHGYKEDDFEYTDIDKSIITPGISIAPYSPEEEVKITNKKSCISKVYTACQGLPGTRQWSFEFEDDLRNGFYN
jgi:hypothetical protein